MLKAKIFYKISSLNKYSRKYIKYNKKYTSFHFFTSLLFE